MKNQSTSLMLLLALLFFFNASGTPKLSSLPTAMATIYLDFDGYFVNNGVWNGGVPFYCSASGMTDDQITEAFYRVSEDYRPFNINITTDSIVFLAAPLAQRIRVVITPTSNWYSGVGGVSYVGSFTWGDDTPCFVFCDRLGPNSPKIVGECCSHESGHTLGLSHQSSYDASCNLTTVYNEGAGNGEISWAPIMGNSYNRNMTSWNNGPTPYGCSIKQDNLSIITTQNGFTYRTDDFADDINTTSSTFNPLNINVDGIISTVTDKDAFKFRVDNTIDFHLDATPYNVGLGNSGADVDLRVQLFDASKKLLNTYDPVNAMNVTIDTILNAGDYYLLVDGSGNSNATDYNSIGSYRLRGSPTVLPIRSIVLTGKAESGTNNLSWNIISDVPVKYLTIESSSDGTSFNEAYTVAALSNNFSFTSSGNADIFYRLKVTSTTGQTVYSNVIILKIKENTVKAFIVSTSAYNDITVNASINFQYLLMDMNGKILSTGNGSQGLNKINIQAQAKGMYVLQLLGNNRKQVERIIK